MSPNKDMIINTCIGDPRLVGGGVSPIVTGTTSLLSGSLLAPHTGPTW